MNSRVIWGLGKSLLAITGIAILLIVVLFVVVVIIHPDDRAYRERHALFRSSLKQAGINFALYESRYHRYPGGWNDIAREMKESPDSFKCPRCGATYVFVPGKPGTFTPSEGAPYSWGRDGIDNNAPPDLPIAFCDHCGEPNDDRYVLFFQGRVDTFAIGSPAEQAIMDVVKRQREAEAAPK